jgi:hypothetical protein
MADVSGVIAGHPLPDLTGANPVEIADALAAAILAAHAEDWPSPLDDQSSVRLCPRCHATADMAVGAGLRNDPTAWPNPLIAVFDEALEARRATGATP